MNAKFLLTQALFLEIAAWLSLSYHFSLIDWIRFLTLHGGGSGLATMALWMLMPAQYKTPKVASFTFIFSLIFFIPGIGIAGAAGSIVLGLYRPIEPLPEFTRTTEVPPLPFKPVQLDTTISFADGGLYQVLRLSNNVDKRLKAVLASQRIEERKSIPVLQIALKDPVDDVRLLAYSVLDKKENDINLQIEQSLKELDQADKSQKSGLHKHLGALYWELVYLELAQGDVLEHILRTAKEHIEATLAEQPDVGASFLLGRIALRQGKLEEAEKAFAQAAELGMDGSSLNSYLAEVAYLNRDYQGMRSLLQLIPKRDLEREPLRDVARYWEVA